MPVALDSYAQETYGSLFPQKSEEGKQKWLLHKAGAPKGETIPDSTSQLLTQTDKEQVCRLLSLPSLVAPDTSRGNVSVQPWK